MFSFYTFPNPFEENKFDKNISLIKENEIESLFMNNEGKTFNFENQIIKFPKSLILVEKINKMRKCNKINESKVAFSCPINTIIEEEIIDKILINEPLEIKNNKLLFDVQNNYNENFTYKYHQYQNKNETFQIFEIEEYLNEMIDYNEKEKMNGSKISFTLSSNKLDNTLNNCKFKSLIKNNSLNAEIFSLNSFDMEINECIYIDSKDHKNHYNNTFQAFKIPILQFNCESKFSSELFTDEWLQELQIDKATFLEFTKSSNCIINHQKVKYNANHQIVQESFKPMQVNHFNQENFLISKSNPYKEQDEKELNTKKVPITVEINKFYFEEDDIFQFGRLFPNFRFIASEMKKPIILIINQKYVNLFFEDVKQYDLNYASNFVADLVQIFDYVVITSVYPPNIFFKNRIRWRLITSVTQITKIILSILLELCRKETH